MRNEDVGRGWRGAEMGVVGCTMARIADDGFGSLEKDCFLVAGLKWSVV